MDQQPQPSTRRARRPRSRAGCSQCVRVSRKCDEARPICGRCARLGFPCDYTPRLIWKPVQLEQSEGPPASAVSPAACALEAAVGGSAQQPAPVSVSTRLEPQPCGCRDRPTGEQLWAKWIADGHHVFHWAETSRTLLLDQTTLYYKRYPAIRLGIQAIVATYADCCRVSSLSRIDQAFTETKQFIGSFPAAGDARVLVAAMATLSQVAMRAGYEWTNQLGQILAVVLNYQGEPDDDADSISSRQGMLEMLGGLDMDAWIVGRRSEPLHIWATYCMCRSGIEAYTGLPRQLLDLISRVSRREDVSAELGRFIAEASMVQSNDALVLRCLAQTSLLHIHVRVRPLSDPDLVLDEIYRLLRCLRKDMGAYNLRILAWPAYLLRGFIRDAEEFELVQHFTHDCFKDQVEKSGYMHPSTDGADDMSSQIVDVGLW